MYNRSMSAHRHPPLLLPIVLAAVLAGCQSREVEKVLKVTNVETGWYDAGIVDGQNKLVPSVRFNLQNVTTEPIESVQVNAVCPGWVDTAMAREGLKGMADSLRVSPEKALTIAMQEVPLGRMSEPEEIAGLVRWLVSDDSRGVTGQGIDINGGAFMH